VILHDQTVITLVLPLALPSHMSVMPSGTAALCLLNHRLQGFMTSCKVTYM